MLNPERRVWYESRVEAAPKVIAPPIGQRTPAAPPIGQQSPAQRRTANQVSVVRVFDCENPDISFSVGGADE